MRKSYRKFLFHCTNTANTLETASGIATGLSSDVDSTTASHRMNPGASALGLIYCRLGGRESPAINTMLAQGTLPLSRSEAYWQHLIIGNAYSSLPMLKVPILLC